MRLYMMSCGRVRSRKSLFVPSADKNEYTDSPSPIFLVTHPKGNVLFDTGPDPRAFEDAKAIWGGLAKAFQPVGDSQSGVLEKLNSIDIGPGDVKYVVNSHLHFDHAGGNRFFPKATFLVTPEEKKCASRPEWEGKGYFRSDWDHPLNYREVEGRLDIFSDGKLTLYPTPGHTPGHQGMLVRLNNRGNVFICGDSVPCRENFEQRVLSRNNMDNELALKTIERIHELKAQEKAMIIYGHDQEFWAGLKKAPEFYE